MKIFIVGAGEVGVHIASRENPLAMADTSRSNNGINGPAILNLVYERGLWPAASRVSIGRLGRLVGGDPC